MRASEQCESDADGFYFFPKELQWFDGAVTECRAVKRAVPQ